MNRARGLIKPGCYFSEFDDGYPPLTMLVTTDVSDSHWTLTARIVRLDKEDGKPRNLTGHPAEHLVLRAQSDLTGSFDPGRIYAYRVCKEGFSIDDLEDLEASVRAIKTIARRVDKYFDGHERTFITYFCAVADAIGADDIYFYTDRRGWLPDSGFEKVLPIDAAARIEREAKEAVK